MCWLIIVLTLFSSQAMAAEYFQGKETLLYFYYFILYLAVLMCAPAIANKGRKLIVFLISLFGYPLLIWVALLVGVIQTNLLLFIVPKTYALSHSFVTDFFQVICYTTSALYVTGIWIFYLLKMKEL